MRAQLFAGACAVICALMLVFPAAALSPEEIERAIRRGRSVNSPDELPPMLMVGEASQAGSTEQAMPGSGYLFLLRGCRHGIAYLAFQAKEKGKRFKKKMVGEGCLGRNENIQVVVIRPGTAEAPPVATLSMEIDGKSFDPASTEHFDILDESTAFSADFAVENVGSTSKVMLFATLTTQQRLDLTVPAAILAEAFESPEKGESVLVAMPHYSFRIPSAHGWRTERFGTPLELVWEVVRLRKETDSSAGPILAEIKLMKDLIVDDSLRAETARHNADIFRNMEKNTMIEAGVNQGLYELHGLTMGEEKIAGKQFYFMDYATLTATDRQPATLYLYFPKERNNETFLIIHSSVVIPVEAASFEYPKLELRQILETLTLY